MNQDPIVKVENVSKIFCRDLKKSLRYGLTDSLADLRTWKRKSDSKKAEERPLRKSEFWANRNISFTLKEGECLGLIGRNGAGKTTLLKMLNGLIKPDSGRIEMNGRVGALIALGAGFNPILTGRENIYVNGSILGLKKQEIDAKLDEILSFANIGDFIDSPVQNYSSGMQVRLGFGVASALSPDILLLDEVLAVGDAAFQAKCFNRLAELRRKGVPFILVSHNMHSIARYCDQVAYMKKGEIDFLGQTEEGIKRYLEEDENTAAGKPLGPDWNTVDGSGRMRLTGAHFEDSQETVVSKIATGSGVTLVISYESVELINDVLLDLSIWSEGTELFHSTSATSDTLFQIEKGSGRLKVNFPSVPINYSRITFNFCIMHKSTSELFDWKRGLPLDLIQNSKQTGNTFFKPSWSHQ